jgi:hypothetical protein
MAQAALAKSAQVHAPGLLGPNGAGATDSGSAVTVNGRSGRWTRRGNKIVLFGA